MKKVGKLSKKQLKQLKAEQLRQLCDEREVLKAQAEEVKRLEWLNDRINHSYGLKNRHDAKAKGRRSSSAQKRAFVKGGPY